MRRVIGELKLDGRCKSDGQRRATQFDHMDVSFRVKGAREGMAKNNNAFLNLS